MGSKLIYKGDPLNTVPEVARLVNYDNATSGLTARNAQDAIDEVASVVKPASSEAVGLVKPDGSTTSVSEDGTISASATWSDVSQKPFETVSNSFVVSEQSVVDLNYETDNLDFTDL